MQTHNRDKKFILDLGRNELEEYFVTAGLEKYRARQLFRSVYVQSVSDFDQITPFSKQLRQQLQQEAYLRALKLVTTTQSQNDLTTKFLWELQDGKKIESVIIYENNRVTFCISSQVGCALDCKFCATGKMGFIRNLSSGEIIEQVLLMREKASLTPTNIVFMGMGEPLLNLRNVLKASDIIADPGGLSFSRKKITISTSGVIPGIKKLADIESPYSLAISLNAVNEETRQKIMPVTFQYPLEDLFEALQYYVKKTKKRITFEYVLIKDINDSQKHADKLLKLTHGLPCKINVIPCNSDDPLYPPPAQEQTEWFSQYVRDKNRTVTIRLRKGWEIQAACGQLYFEHKNIEGTKIKQLK